MMQLVYRSRPFGFDNARLGSILASARRNNVRDGITGALICRADLYLQLLEGEEAVVERAFHRIRADDRHCDVALVSAAPVTARLFPQWAMRDDPARSWMWSAAEVAAGVLETATPASVCAIFERLADEPATCH